MSWSSPTYMQSKMAYVMVDSSIVGCAQSYTLDTTRSIQEIQCIGSDSVRKISGPYNWSVSFDALQILSQDASIGIKNYEDLMDKFLSTSNTVTVKLMPKTADVSAGQVYYSGTGIIESISLNSAAGEAPGTYSVSVQGSGDLTRNTL